MPRHLFVENLNRRALSRRSLLQGAALAAAAIAVPHTGLAAQNLQIDATATTPSVNFDSSTGILKLEGVSTTKDSTTFYKPLMDWIDSYANSPKPDTVMHIKMASYNDSSSKRILDLFKKLENVRGGTVKVKWYYKQGDEDMLEAGEDFQAIISVPFELITTP